MKVIEANSKVVYKSLDELIDGVGVDKVKEGLVKHIKGYQEGETSFKVKN